MDVVGKGLVLEFANSKKMPVEITRFWASCYFTGHAFELVFDILAHKILKITFFSFFSFEKSFKKCFMAFC